jgi:ribulose-5-phosphate 4-epimerase/fuculose-1-phosphate aldolase
MEFAATTEKVIGSICTISHKLAEEKLIIFPDGNISVSVGDLVSDVAPAYFATCTGTAKDNLTEDDIGLFTKHGAPIGENKPPTKDFGIHMAIYAAAAHKARAVIHAHGVWTIEYARRTYGRQLDHPLGIHVLQGIYRSPDQLRAGMVYVSEPAHSGTDMIVNIVAEGARHSRIVLVPGSGSYAYSTFPDPISALKDCLRVTMYIEEMAKILVPQLPNAGFDGNALLSSLFDLYGEKTKEWEFPLFRQIKTPSRRRN